MDSRVTDDFSSLFEFLPIGAYRSSPDGRQLRANPALVRLNGYANEAEMLAAVVDIGRDWYVKHGRRDEFRRRLETDGRVVGFESEVHRHRTRERIWVSENAHLVRDALGAPRYYEGTIEDITERVLAQQKIDQLVELTPGMIYRLAVGPGDALRVVFVSAGSRALLGIEPDMLVAEPRLLRTIRHPDDAARVQAEIAAATRVRGPWHSEFRVVLRDGTVKWLEGHSNAIPDDGSGAQQRVGIFQDITDRVRATRALQRSEQRLQQLVELIPGVVYRLIVRPDGTRAYSYVSDHVREMYGLEPAEVLADGMAMVRMRHPGDTGHIQEQAERAIREQRELRYEVRLQLPDGREKWVQVTSVPAPREDDCDVRVGVIFDITEHKQAEVLRIERDRATAANLAKSQFLSRVSHELRTPLNAILGFTQLLELDPGVGAGERQRGWVQQVLGSGRHLLALMDDILDLSSVQTGQLPMTIEPFAVGPLLGEVLAMLGGAAADAGIELQADWAMDGARHAVRGDRKRVKQIVSNLLSNAIKYNQPQGHVRLSTAVRDGTLSISVADNGPGLTPDQQARLFQPFERLGAQRGPVAGTGLGLALSRQLAEAMGGAVDVASTPGRGSTFTLTLPQA